MPATTTLLPTSEWVPATSRAPFKPPRPSYWHARTAPRRGVRARPRKPMTYLKQRSQGEPAPQRQARRVSPPEDLLHRCLLLGVLAPVRGHGRKASLLTPGSLLTLPSRCGGGFVGFAPRSQWRDRAGLAPASWTPSPPVCPRAA